MSTALITGLTIGLGIPTLLFLRYLAQYKRRDKNLEQHVKNNPWLFDDTGVQRDSDFDSHVKNNSWLFNSKTSFSGGKKTRKSKKK